MRHPAEFYLKALLIKEPGITDAQLLMELQNRGFLTPEPVYFQFLRPSLGTKPEGFNPMDRLHRPSMRYLRSEGVYDMFYPTAEVQEAKLIIHDIEKRMAVEQVIMARLDSVQAVRKLNQKHGWQMTAGAVDAYRHFFWNVQLLSFDEWGRFLYERSSMYERYMGLLRGPTDLAYFHLAIDQILDSKKMIQETQKIAYFTMREVAQKPGAGQEKVKAIALLGKTVIDCHVALSTSDMQIKDVLSQFERFQMNHTEMPAPDIKLLAPEGNFTGSGMGTKTDNEKEPVQ